MGQSTPTQDRPDPNQSETAVSMSVDQPIPDGPVSDWIVLDDDEELIWEAKVSLKQLIPDVLLSVVMVGIGTGLLAVANLDLVGFFPSGFQLPASIFGGVFFVGSILFLGYSYISHRKRRYAITTTATYRRWGDSVARIPLSSVSNVRIADSSILDRLFSCGDVTIQWEENEPQEMIFPAVPNSEWATEMLHKTRLSIQRNSSHSTFHDL